MSPLPDYTAARDTARTARKGTPIYPRQIMREDGTWARQDHPGGPYIDSPIPNHPNTLTSRAA